MRDAVQGAPEITGQKETPWELTGSSVHQVVDKITTQLYEQTMDTQEGVIYYLLEEMSQQRIKENLLAYALLLLRGSPHLREEEYELSPRS